MVHKTGELDQLVLSIREVGVHTHTRVVVHWRKTDSNDGGLQRPGWDCLLPPSKVRFYLGGSIITDVLIDGIEWAAGDVVACSRGIQSIGLHHVFALHQPPWGFGYVAFKKVIGEGSRVRVVRESEVVLKETAKEWVIGNLENGDLGLAKVVQLVKTAPLRHSLQGVPLHYLKVDEVHMDGMYFLGHIQHVPVFNGAYLRHWSPSLLHIMV